MKIKRRSLAPAPVAAPAPFCRISRFGRIETGLTRKRWAKERFLYNFAAQLAASGFNVQGGGMMLYAANRGR